HRWHVDVEAFEWPSVNIWLALSNTGELSGLKVAPGTHRLGTSLHDATIMPPPDLDDDSSVSAAAQALGVKTECVRLFVRPGEFVVFDGRIWHASDNGTERD